LEKKMLKKFATWRIVKWSLGALSRIGSTWNLILALVFLIGSPLLTISVIGLGFIPLVGSFISAVLIVLCAIGAAVGGLLLRGAMETLVPGKVSERNEEPSQKREAMARENERQKGEIANKDRDLQLVREENLKLELEKAKLQNAKERLERMTIQMDSAAPILKLGLMKVKMTNYDFQPQPLDHPEIHEEGLFPFKKKVQEESEYLGLQRITMEANLGIDLKQVNVTEHDGVLYVSGIKSESHGITHRETEWLLREIRKKRTVDGEVAEHRIDANDKRVMDLVLDQQRSLDSRLNQGLEFAAHDDTIHRIAEGYIRLLLSPTGKRVEFLSPENESGGLLPLEQYIGQHNMGIDVQKNLLIEQEREITRQGQQETSMSAPLFQRAP
jgi:hypothetical protein